MFTTYIVYAAFALLLLWGGKFAGFKNTQFNDDAFSLEITKALRGFAAIGVIIHHCALERAFQQANGNDVSGELALFLNAGYRFVAIFFFCSGFGLIKSLKTKPDYLKSFMKKRVLKAIIVPYYVSILIYALYKLITGEHLSPLQWITNFAGITMMSSYSWYPVVAAILYTAFYFFFKNIKNTKVCFALMAILIILLGLIFCINGHFTWWAGEKNWWLSPSSELRSKWWTGHNVWWFSGEWWVNSAPALFTGMLFAQFEEKIAVWFKKNYWLKFTGVLVVMVLFYLLTCFALSEFGYWTEFSGQGEGTVNKLITYFLQIPESMWLTVLLFVIMMKYHVSNPVVNFFGKYSLETYMMNLIAITSCRYLLYTAETVKIPFGMTSYYWAGRINLLLYVLSVFASSILLGIIYKYLCSKANSLVGKNE